MNRSKYGTVQVGMLVAISKVRTNAGLCKLLEKTIREGKLTRAITDMFFQQAIYIGRKQYKRLVKKGGQV